MMLRNLSDATKIFMYEFTCQTIIAQIELERDRAKSLKIIVLKGFVVIQTQETTTTDCL